MPPWVRQSETSLLDVNTPDVNSARDKAGEDASLQSAQEIQSVIERTRVDWRGRAKSAMQIIKFALETKLA